MMRYLWHAVAAFGDTSILLPCALLIALVLAVRESTRRISAMWLAAVVGTAAIVAATKLLYMGWGLGVAALDFTGLSGHTSLSLVVWPVALFLFAGQTNRRRILAAAVGGAAAFAIAASRLGSRAHSVSEVALAAVLGCAVSSLFLLRYGRPLTAVAPRRWLAVALMLPLVIGYAHAAPTQALLEGLARALSGHSHVYTRSDLHSGSPRAQVGDGSADMSRLPANRPDCQPDCQPWDDQGLSTRRDASREVEGAAYPSTEGPSMVEGSSTLSASSAVSTPSAITISRTVRFSFRAFCASLAARS